MQVVVSGPRGCRVFERVAGRCRVLQGATHCNMSALLPSPPRRLSAVDKSHNLAHSHSTVSIFFRLVRERRWISENVVTVGKCSVDTRRSQW